MANVWIFLFLPLVLYDVLTSPIHWWRKCNDSKAKTYFIVFHLFKTGLFEMNGPSQWCLVEFFCRIRWRPVSSVFETGKWKARKATVGKSLVRRILLWRPALINHTYMRFIFDTDNSLTHVTPGISFLYKCALRIIQMFVLIHLLCGWPMVAISKWAS